MGMDIFGNSGNYFRANIWQWSAICYAIHLSGYPLPESWQYCDGDGLGSQRECDVLADKLESFLVAWQGERIVYDEGVSVGPNAAPPIRTAHLWSLIAHLEAQHGGRLRPLPGAGSPFETSREHLRAFIEFLRECDGFEIH